MNDKNIQGEMVLEVIACTVDDAIKAEKGGANRLEVISRFDVGGLTPSLDLVHEIKDKVELPMRVMLRESTGYEGKDDAEIKTLCDAACELNKIGVDGVVLGFLDASDIDMETTRRVLDAAPDLNATFHHAFEDTVNKFVAIRKFKDLPQIDRILSHGGDGSPADRAVRLAAYEMTAKPEIRIIAGGRVNADMIRELLSETTINEFHVGSAARINGKVERSRVAELVKAMSEIYV
ncbi:MAG TPA: copper homeostasis protein CutC [Pyrinomonadaceae bacterium]|jgi:copper homeostasis protein|nr:copper homeostasis protein CutC [Pyrinomonadaceae bacterium]